MIPEAGGWPFTVNVPEIGTAWMSASSVAELVSDTPARTTRQLLPAPYCSAATVVGL